MNLPESIIVTDCHGFLDGGTIVVEARSDTGESIQFRLNQHVFAGKSNPGRLEFEGELIGARSEEESQLLQLLADATVDPSTENYDDPEDALTESEFQEHRDKITAYVKSDEYVEIANNGSSDPRLIKIGS